jgi:hypothetical protein
MHATARHHQRVLRLGEKIGGLFDPLRIGHVAI